ncbi:MAG: CBS domain-containing protein [Cyclobacteriaceae bacterium]
MKNIDQPIATVMTKNVITIELTEHNLESAERLFRKHKIKHLPIVDKGNLVGLLSLTDLQRLSFVNNFGDDELDVDTAIYDMLSLEQVMVGKPVMVSSQQSIREVAEILSKETFHALPVTENGQLVGIVTTTDLIKLLLEEAA